MPGTSQVGSLQEMHYVVSIAKYRIPYMGWYMPAMHNLVSHATFLQRFTH